MTFKALAILSVLHAALTSCAKEEPSALQQHSSYGQCDLQVHGTVSSLGAAWYAQYGVPSFTDKWSQEVTGAVIEALKPFDYKITHPNAMNGAFWTSGTLSYIVLSYPFLPCNGTFRMHSDVSAMLGIRYFTDDSGQMRANKLYALRAFDSSIDNVVVFSNYLIDYESGFQTGSGSTEPE